MKLQCNGCQAAEANVVCCADEAALCWECDHRIHAANKLAGKHQRVSLSTSDDSSSTMPNCDICQETIGYFFCLQDRAMLCRKCDVAIHTANPFVSVHQRFLLTGVKVGLEAIEPSASSSNENSDSVQIASAPHMSRSAVTPTTDGMKQAFPRHYGGVSSAASDSLTEGTPSGTNNVPVWLSHECLGLTDLIQNYGFLDSVSLSKVCPKSWFRP